jgi:hypothetical protein
MRAFLTLLLVGLTALPLRAGDDGLTGNWKMIIFEDNQPANLWLLRLENKAGKLSGAVEGLKGVPETAIADLSVVGDLLQFELRIPNVGKFQFEGKTPRAGAKKVLGSVTRESKTVPAYLEATAAKNGFELDREVLTRTPNDPRVFGAALDLIAAAKENKTPAKDVQEWLDTVQRSAEAYGPRFQLDYTMKLVEVLAKEKDYADLSAGIAVKAESLLDPKASALAQLRFLSTLGGALRKSAATEKIKDIDARIEKLEEAAFAEYAKTALGFAPDKFAGRKGKSDRVVLVELFTGAMCPPCVAADLAFDAVEKAFASKDVVLLQYHLHIPGPDALTNGDCEKRGEYYGRSLRGTPTIYFNGKPDKNVQGGGGREDAADKYKDYREALEALLEKPAGAQLQAKAIRKGDKIAIQASVKDVAKPGESTRLRIALVEDWVRYKSRNGMLYHHRVVRAMPGGVAGLALTKKDMDHTVTLDLGELRTTLHKYLDDFAKNESPFPDAQRPMRLRDLHVVAFVQLDDTYEVLQAIDVPVMVE